MGSLSRRELLMLGLAASAGIAVADEAESADIHRQILDMAARLEKVRRERFAAVKSKAELEDLQKSLRETFLRLIGGLPRREGAPPVKTTGRIETDDYVVEKLVYESFPGYFVSALLYKPTNAKSPLPAVISPCGHSAIGKAAREYQILHMNLARRGYVVLTYDPVGQGERSQFWDDERKRSRFNLVCGEHAVLGNALYLIGSSLARFRIWDGMRGIDYLISLPEVDSKKIGCVGNSGGGTLTSYLAALDTRIAAAAIGCYITTLPRRMGNRIEADPSSDPEQDIYGFVSEGIDHAGLLALCAPRPTLLGTAEFDFFPIEGARESFAEAQRLYEVAGAKDRITRAQAAERHGLTLPLRKAVYDWFDRWLAGREHSTPTEELDVKPRSATELAVCEQGQVSICFQSRPLLSLALEEFRKQQKPRRKPLRELLKLDSSPGKPHVTEIASQAAGKTLVLCINGNEAPDWRAEPAFFQWLALRGHAIAVVDPRGAGALRPNLTVKGHDYSDPISGVEENIAYNAFLVGQSLLGLRVSDVLEAVKQLTAKAKPNRVILCGRKDAALVACFAAAVDPRVHAVATEDMLLSFERLFDVGGFPFNAASVLPGLLRDFGDIPDVLAQIAPRRVLIASGIGASAPATPTVQVVEGRFSKDANLMRDLLEGG